MLTSMTNSGPFSLLSKPYSFEELDKLRQKESFFCPACRQPMELKLGTIKRFHFAHRKKTVCAYDAEPETERHALGKQQLYQRLKDMGEIELEPYLPRIRQRPDLLLTVDSKKYAIEYQCSSIPNEQVIKRNKGYKRLGIIPVWILGSNQLQRTGASEYRLNSFHWLLARTFPHALEPFLLFYCPENKHLLQLSHFYPFSKQIFHAKASLINFEEVLDPKLTKEPSITDWLKRKILKFRTYPPAKHVSALQKTLYIQKRIPLSLLPSIVFIPCKFDFAFETEPYVWKTQLLLRLETRTSFTKGEILSVLSFLEKEGHIIKRKCECSLPSNEEVADELRRTLLKAGILERMEKNNTYRFRPVRWSSRMTEVLKRDKEFFRLISFLEHNL
ncbi:hypothetical protein CEF21_08760 [Bacillus sp. FJAT-42376]|uniref:competence protein CoiA n=1 Tax=Bacillus sp. FJAT-42376 TaxID=2014076 RepID=UPI000F514DB6|nr:competence protein CoiA family protein [Bacillus sp. FJAT-42376]AZB42373.1 hypothetical protein CEF21_08760 [Bacillus sp. FJAT-42376]